MVADPEDRTRSIGGSRFGCLLGLAIFVAASYVDAPFVRAELKYRSASEEIQNEATQLRADERSEVLEALAPVIKELGLPPGAERFAVRPITSGVRRFQVTIEYAETLRVLNWQKIIRRTIEAETP